jgi:hypothetical protein
MKGRPEVSKSLRALEENFHLGYNKIRVRWFFGTGKFCRNAEGAGSSEVTAREDRE